MALTDAEREELRKLREKKRRAQEAQAAQEHQRRYSEAMRNPEEGTFSLSRLTENIGRDIFRNIESLDYDFNHSDVGRVLNKPLFALQDISNWEEWGSTERAVLSRPRYMTEEAEGTEGASGAEQALREIGGWLVPFTGAMKGLKGIRALSTAGRGSRAAQWGRATAAGVFADFTTADKVEDNLLNYFHDEFGLDVGVVNGLLTEEDDSAMMNRFKSAVTGAMMGLATDAALELGGKALKALKFWRGSREEALATLENFDRGPIELRGADESLDDAAEGAADDLAAEADEWTIKPDDGRPIESFDDVIQYIVDKAGDTSMSDDAFADFAENLLRGEPENVLGRFGIRKQNWDVSLVEDPAQLARIQDGLTEAFSRVSARLGRTGERVSFRQMARDAEGLAVDPRVLKELHKSTKRLAERLTAGRIIVGSHADTVLTSAKEALKEIEETGARGAKWDEFMKDFWRHGLVLGTITGASSEIARALASLRKAVKVGPKAVTKAEQSLKEAVKEDAAERAGFEMDDTSFSEARGEFDETITTTNEAIQVLQGAIRAGGDVGQLNKAARKGNLGWIRDNVSPIVKESVGNLFGAKTAAMNLTSGLTMLAVDGLGKTMSAIARTPALIFGSERAKHEARRAALEAWAYSQGTLAWSEAMRNGIAVLKREGLSEAALFTDALGLEDTARKLQLSAGDQERLISGDFERGSIVGNKALGVSAKTRKKLDAWVREWATNDETENVNRFMDMGLKALIRTLSSSVNAAGAVTRSGTAAFIHVPDQVIGTLSQNADGFARAVQIASDEAWDRGIRGSEATEFIKARSIDLFEGGPSTWGKYMDDKGARGNLARYAHQEAKDKIFQTKPETAIGKWAAQGGHAMGSWLVPFVNTIVRIPERTITEFSPMALISKTFKEAIAEGGSRRDAALARMFIGTISMALGGLLVDHVIGNDGGYTKTARDAGVQSYSVVIGGDTFEFNSMEPIGSLLGIGADLREYMTQAADDPEKSQESDVTKVLFGSLGAIGSNILAKNWLQSVEKLSAALSANEDQRAHATQQFLNSYSARIVPGAGLQKMAYNWNDGALREAHGFWEKVLGNTIMAGNLPQKMDSLGRPLQRHGMDRYFGLPLETIKTADTDPLMAELGALNMRDFVPQKTQGGVRLNNEQMSLYTKMRGTEVRDKTGMTMEEKLRALISTEQYRSATDAKRIALIRRAKRPYGRLARLALEERDPEYARSRIREVVYEEAELRGLDERQRNLMLEIALQRHAALTGQ